MPLDILGFVAHFIVDGKILIYIDLTQTLNFGRLKIAAFSSDNLIRTLPTEYRVKINP